MQQEGLHVYYPRKRKFCSYCGEVSPEVPNLLKRNSRATETNQKWLTDITEFAIPAGKIYLSPIIDCYDGMPVSWTIGTSPTVELANTMLKKAVASSAAKTIQLFTPTEVVTIVGRNELRSQKRQP